RRESPSTEVAQRHDRRTSPREGRSAPVIDGRQLGPDGRSVGHSFVPAHPRDVIVPLPLGIAAALPRCRAGPAGLVPEPSHRLAPEQLVTAGRERSLPQLLLLISAVIDEALEFLVGDLV